MQYQTGPIHESDNHIFAKISGGGGVGWGGWGVVSDLWIRACVVRRSKKRVRSTSFFNALIFYLKVEMKKKTVVPKLLQEVKVKVDIVTSDDIKI